MHSKSSVFSVKDIAVIGMMAAMIEAVKTVLASVPGVELVTLLIVLFTLFLGWKALIAVWAFVGMECAVWGIGLWTVMYVYIWPLLVVATLLLRKSKSIWPFCFLCGFYGLTFGAFCAIPYLFIGGPVMAFNWWVSGIPYDLVHGISNFVIALVAFRPLHAALTRVKKTLYA